ncbi:MAG: hypothetical protein Q9M13_09660 [Mariprofundales bacterium]|nr:hypothetical protein [Mariprofundales bacterium]
MNRYAFKAGILPLLALAWAAPAGAAMFWQPIPSSHGNIQHNRMAAKQLNLHDGYSADVRFMHADLEVQTLSLDDDKITLHPTGKNNYHVLTAHRTRGKLHETAIRYLFLHGKPTGHSPSELTAAGKAQLEIVPSPLPREHWHYQGSKQALFRILFRGQPLTDHAVTITSGNGTAMRATTDAEGVIQLTVPDDFAAIKPGRMHNPPAEWQLTVQHNYNGQQYQTTLTAPYYVNPHHWQTLSWGVAATGGAMIPALFMLIRRQKNRANTNKKRGE